MDGDSGDSGGGHDGDCGHHESCHHASSGDAGMDSGDAGHSGRTSVRHSRTGDAKLKTKEVKNKDAVITFCIVAAVVVGAAILYRDWQQKHKEEAASNGLSR